MKTGTKGKERIVNLNQVKQSLENRKSAEIQIDQVLDALPGIQAFTGCNTVSGKDRSRL